jgi:hypothetical protein
MKNEAKEMTESSNDTSEASSPSKDQEWILLIYLLLLFDVLDY